jgi:peroxiredoxin
MTMATHADLLEEQVRAAEEEWLELWAQGPTRTSWSHMPPQIGQPAPNLELVDSNGNLASLSSFWGESPALIIFLRQFGCSCGLERATTLREQHDDYVAAGARVVAIGQGEPERSAVYAERYDIPCTLLCDPEYQAYEAYGLVEGQPSQILFDAPEEFWAHEHELGAEFQRQRREQGRPLVDNPWLLPGEFVVDRSGIIRLAYRYQYCEDFPNPLVLTTAIRTAKSA